MSNSQYYLDLRLENMHLQNHTSISFNIVIREMSVLKHESVGNGDNLILISMMIN